MARTISSRPHGAMTCRPIGNPSGSKPQGTEAAGRPARLIGQVNGDQPRCRSTFLPSIRSTPSVPALKAVTDNRRRQQNIDIRKQLDELATQL